MERSRTATPPFMDAKRIANGGERHRIASILLQSCATIISGLLSAATRRKRDRSICAAPVTGGSSLADSGDNVRLARSSIRDRAEEARSTCRRQLAHMEHFRVADNPVPAESPSACGMEALPPADLGSAVNRQLPSPDAVVSPPDVLARGFRNLFLQPPGGLGPIRFLPRLRGWAGREEKIKLKFSCLTSLDLAVGWRHGFES